MTELLNPENKPRFLRAREVAENFFQGKISYIKVLKLTKEGILPGIKIGKNYFYTPEALTVWADRNGRTI